MNLYGVCFKEVLTDFNWIKKAIVASSNENEASNIALKEFSKSNVNPLNLVEITSLGTSEMHETQIISTAYQVEIV